MQPIIFMPVNGKTVYTNTSFKHWHYMPLMTKHIVRIILKACKAQIETPFFLSNTSERISLKFALHLLYKSEGAVTF